MPGINAVPRRESRPGALKGTKGRSHGEILAMVGLTVPAAANRKLRVSFHTHGSADTVAQCVEQ